MKKEYGEPLMKIKYGEYTDVSGYLGPTRMLGFFTDILHEGSRLYALVLWKWYIGLEM